MSKVKRCVQCGILKEEDEFRPYTYSKSKGTSGRYRICKSCEAINTAYRRARTILETPFSVFENKELYEKSQHIVEKTDQLYRILVMRGLRVPTMPTPAQEEETPVDKLISFYNAASPQPQSVVAPVVVSKNIPDELSEWLNADTSTWYAQGISPEYLQETVYESLKAKYRPQIGVDKETYLPMYDDTFKDVLNKILRRFDDYEEEYSNTAEEEEE